jgi:cation diffusion facilitator CzcD-associated flavoprotein CzcO
LYRSPSEKLLTHALNYYRESQIKDPELRKIVKPNYTVGCKRIMITNDWYCSINRPNVQVIPKGIDYLEEDGVVTADGKSIPCDVIILGTGYETQRMDYNSGFDIQGRDGMKIVDFWRKEGAMKAYKGVTTPNMPNYFVTMGPNTNLGHNSVVYMIESQIEYTIACLKYMQVKGKKVVEIKQKPYEEYNNTIQHSLKNSVWNTGGCTSWYLDGAKHNTSLWGKGFTFLYRWMLERFDAENYILN